MSVTTYYPEGYGTRDKEQVFIRANTGVINDILAEIRSVAERLNFSLYFLCVAVGGMNFRFYTKDEALMFAWGMEIGKDLT